mmetsp:Transcript_18324/g.43085  ORF Transcript_18324/g.43085 Transcript_18324/m.43085 type:complete len:117 (+) Transcript_18324:12-362(+)
MAGRNQEESSYPDSISLDVLPASRESRNVSEETRRKKKRKIPWKNVGLAVFLFVVGSCMLLGGVFTLAEDGSRAFAMIVIGAIAFIPGAYATYISYNAWRQTPGFAFEQLPDYDRS